MEILKPEIIVRFYKLYEEKSQKSKLQEFFLSLFLHLTYMIGSQNCNYWHFPTLKPIWNIRLLCGTREKKE